MHAYINSGILLLAAILLTISYSISVQPLRLSKTKSESAFKTCAIYRKMTGVAETVIFICYGLFFWLPDPLFPTIPWPHWVSLVIGVPLVLFGTVLLISAAITAGQETMRPNRQTTMFGGIYHHIRHPQTTGTLLFWFGFAFTLHTLFLMMFSLILIVAYSLPLFYEEKDLILKYGDSYRQYKKKVGAFWPKFKRTHKS